MHKGGGDLVGEFNDFIVFGEEEFVGADGNVGFGEGGGGVEGGFFVGGLRV